MAQDPFASYNRSFIQSTDSILIYTLVGGDKDKPPLLLLHGFPQTHAEFHKIVPTLEQHFTLVLIDLRGYGKSSIVDSQAGSGMTKRAMAKDCVLVMKHLGFTKFSILGHDRGARVAYRLAFDHPQYLDKVIVIDIIPTAAMYQEFSNVPSALKAYHWLFLAQPQPFPEDMILAASQGKRFLDHTLASWTQRKSLADFSDYAMLAYTEAFCDPQRVHMACEDYRAGALIDYYVDADDVGAGRKIDVPLLAIWGNSGLFAGQMKDLKSPAAIWRDYAVNLSTLALPCGHFITEEEPEKLLHAVLDFFNIPSTFAV